MKKGTKIGIDDVNGTPIKNGDKVTVEFVNYMDTKKEYVDDVFNGEIFYNSFNCMFMILRPDKIRKIMARMNDIHDVYKKRVMGGV